MNGCWRSGLSQIIQPIAVSRPISICCFVTEYTDWRHGVVLYLFGTVDNKPCSLYGLSWQYYISSCYRLIVVWDTRKNLNRDQPVFLFAGKRQCRLLDQYSNLSWVTACSIRISLFCFPCLIFKLSTTAWSLQTRVTDLGNFINLVRKREFS